MRNTLTAYILACSIFGSLSIKSMEEPPDWRKRLSPEREAQENGKKLKTEQPQYMPEMKADATPVGKAFMIAAAMGNEEEMQKALDMMNRHPSYYDHAPDLHERSPLWFAAANGHTAMVRILLGMDAHRERCDKNGKTPLRIAAENGHLEVVKLLLHNYRYHYDEEANIHHYIHYIDIEDQHGYTALQGAAQNGHEPVVSLLLDNGAYIDVWSSGDTPLYLAVENGHHAVVKLLIERNANIERESHVEGITLLHKACRMRHFGMVRELLRNGAQLNREPDNGEEPPEVWDRRALDAFDEHPLLLAAVTGNLAEIRTLVNHETTSADILETLIFSIAQAQEHVSPLLIALLIQRGSPQSINEALAHVNTLLSRSYFTPERRAACERIRAQLTAPQESLLMQGRCEYGGDPETRRAYARDLIARLLTRQDMTIRERANYDTIQGILLSNARVNTVLNNALVLIRNLLSKKITHQEQTDYQNLVRLLQPPEYARLREVIATLKNILAQTTMSSERSHYERLLATADQTAELVGIITARLADVNLDNPDRQHYEKIKKLLTHIPQSHLRSLPDEVFMRILGWTLPGSDSMLPSAASGG